jgi:hypothetical protein
MLEAEKKKTEKKMGAARASPTKKVATNNQQL